MSSCNRAAGGREALWCSRRAPTAAAGCRSVGGRLAALAGGAAAQLLGQLLLAQLAALVILCGGEGEGGQLATGESNSSSAASTPASTVPASTVPARVRRVCCHASMPCRTAALQREPPFMGKPAGWSTASPSGSAAQATHRLGLDRLPALRQDQLNVAGAGHVGVDAAVRAVGPAGEMGWRTVEG